MSLNTFPLVEMLALPASYYESGLFLLSVSTKKVLTFVNSFFSTNGDNHNFSPRFINMVYFINEFSKTEPHFHS